LDAAYDAGIRHFDVAPMYGLGLAEPELGRFLRGRPGITVGTKFGISPSPLGRMTGRVQAPLRVLLQRRHGMQERIKQSGASPLSGIAGRALYRRTGYDPAAAHRALLSSLTTLGLDRVDIYLLHEPEIGSVRDADAITRFLERERDSAGRIRAWGLAGDVLPRAVDPEISTLMSRADVLQRPDDPFTDVPATLDEHGSATITFGVFSSAMATLNRIRSDTPEVVAQWSDEIGVDLGRTEVLADILIKLAVSRNPNGVTLFSTTKVNHVQRAVSAIDTPLTVEEQQVVSRVVEHLAGHRP
jgi:D-threo-aldose 1-dehydrogenase